jgi:protein ImuB
VLRDTHRPDSFIMERFVVPISTPKETKARHAAALRRFRPPIELSVRYEGRSYIFLSSRQTLYRTAGLRALARKWRLVVVRSLVVRRWDVRATYNKASINETLLCLIAHNLLSHRWQLEALYD